MGKADVDVTNLRFTKKQLKRLEDVFVRMKLDAEAKERAADDAQYAATECIENNNDKAEMLKLKSCIKHCLSLCDAYYADEINTVLRDCRAEGKGR